MLLFVSAAFAIPPVPELGVRPPVLPIDGHELCWPSGLEIQALHRPNTSLVTIATVVQGGTAAEDRSERGAAHLVEHLWFQSRFDGRPTVAARTAGLEVQGLTFPDATVFTTVADGADLDALLRLEAERLLDPLAGIAPEGVQSEQMVVQNEILMRGEHTFRAAHRELDNVLFPADWSYHAGPTTLADNAALTPDVLEAYAVRTYRPENTTIRVEGNVDPQQIQAAVQRTFAPVLLRGSGRGCLHDVGTRAPPSPVSTTLVEITAPVLDPLLFVGWTVPPGFGEPEIDGQMAAVWLQDEIRTEVHAPGMDHGVLAGCSHDARREASVLLCVIPLGDGVDPAKVVERVGRAVRRASSLDVFIHTSVKATAFDNALVSADRIDAGALADRALFAHFVDGQIDPMPVYTRRVFTADTDVVDAFAEEWLTPDRMASVVLLPGEVETKASARVDGRAVLDVPWADEPGATADWTLPDPRLDTWQVHTLDNGMEVWTAPRPGGSPVAFSSLGFPRGATAGVPGVERAHDLRVRYSAQVPFSVFHNGTGVRFSDVFEPSMTSFRAEGPSGNLDAQMWILRVLASEWTYRGRASDLAFDDAFWTELGRHASQFQTPSGDAHLFPRHRFGEAWWEPYRQMTEVSRAEMTSWNRAVVFPEGAVLVVSGWVDPDRTFELADRFLGGWKRKPGTPLAPPPLSSPPQRAVFGLVDDALGLSAVEVSCRVPARTVDSDAAIDVLAFLVRASLDQTLRENGGIYAYYGGVDSGLREVSVVRMGAQVPPSVAASTVRAMFGVLARIAEEPSAAVVEWAKREVVSELARDLASGHGSVAVGRAAAGAGLSFAELKDYPVRVDEVDGAQVRALLGDCVGHEAATVLGPAVDLSSLDATPVDWRGQAAALTR